MRALSQVGCESAPAGVRWCREPRHFASRGSPQSLGARRARSATAYPRAARSLLGRPTSRRGAENDCRGRAKERHGAVSRSPVDRPPSRFAGGRFWLTPAREYHTRGCASVKPQECVTRALVPFRRHRAQPRARRCRGLLEVRQKLAPASSADDDTVAQPPRQADRRDHPRFARRLCASLRRGAEHSSSQSWTAAWRCDRTRGATLKSRMSCVE